MGETIPQGEGAQIPCAVVLGDPWALKEGLQIPGFWGWVLRVLILQVVGFSGTCDVSREGTGADFHAFESKLGIPELRTLRTWGQRSLILRL